MPELEKSRGASRAPEPVEDRFSPLTSPNNLRRELCRVERRLYDEDF